MKTEDRNADFIEFLNVHYRPGPEELRPPEHFQQRLRFRLASERRRGWSAGGWSVAALVLLGMGLYLRVWNWEGPTTHGGSMVRVEEAIPVQEPVPSRVWTEGELEAAARLLLAMTDVSPVFAGPGLEMGSDLDAISDLVFGAI